MKYVMNTNRKILDGERNKQPDTDFGFIYLYNEL